MKYELFKPLAIYQQGKRENQEDSIYPEFDQATENDRLFIVCDGMGGWECGEVASSTVCKAISRYINAKTDPKVPFTDEMLSNAMAYAYTALNMKVQSEANMKMGTTLAMFYFHAGGVMAAHIGDSRYYHIRPDENKILYRSKDHSLVFSLFEAGQITEEEMATHEKKNVILRAIRPGQNAADTPDIVHIKDVRPGDWFLLMSDGMVETMTDEEILHILSNNSLSDAQKRDWFQMATSENSDNHSAYLIHINGVTAELVERAEPDDEQEARSRNPLFTPRQNNAYATPHKDGVTTNTDPEPVVVVEEDTEEGVVQYSASRYQQTPQQPVYPQQAYPQEPQSKSSNKGMILGAIIALAIVGAAFGFYFMNNKTEKTVDEPVTPVHIISNDGPASQENTITNRTNDAPKADPSSSTVDVKKESESADKLINGKSAEKIIKGKTTEDKNDKVDNMKKALEGKPVNGKETNPSGGANSDDKSISVKELEKRTKKKSEETDNSKTLPTEQAQ